MSAVRPLAVLVLLAGFGAAHADDDDVTIYRCTDAQGRLTISDAPCPKGQQQQTRSMLRPKDAPPRAASLREPASEPMPAMTPSVVVINTPRPLYECVTPDGERYTSDSGEGNPRWVPLWTLGYPVARPPFDARRGASVRTGSGLSAPPSAGISAPTRAGISAPTTSGISIPPLRDRPRPSPGVRPHPPGHHHPGFIGYGAGTWVRDDCYALPQAEVCARLADRRDELRTRFFNAQQRERDRLRVEERGLNARLAEDCELR